jgi:hypothetical protein
MLSALGGLGAKFSVGGHGRISPFQALRTPGSLPQILHKSLQPFDRTRKRARSLITRRIGPIPHLIDFDRGGVAPVDPQQWLFRQFHRIYVAGDARECRTAAQPAPKRGECSRTSLASSRDSPADVTSGPGRVDDQSRLSRNTNVTQGTTTVSPLCSRIFCGKLRPCSMSL